MIWKFFLAISSVVLSIMAILLGIMLFLIGYVYPVVIVILVLFLSVGIIAKGIYTKLLGSSDQK